MASAQICSRPQLRQFFVVFERYAIAREKKKARDDLPRLGFASKGWLNHPALRQTVVSVPLKVMVTACVVTCSRK